MTQCSSGDTAAEGGHMGAAVSDRETLPAIVYQAAIIYCFDKQTDATSAAAAGKLRLYNVAVSGCRHRERCLV